MRIHLRNPSRARQTSGPYHSDKDPRTPEDCEVKEMYRTHLSLQVGCGPADGSV